MGVHKPTKLYNTVKKFIQSKNLSKLNILRSTYYIFTWSILLAFSLPWAYWTRPGIFLLKQTTFSLYFVARKLLLPDACFALITSQNIPSLAALITFDANTQFTPMPPHSAAQRRAFIRPEYLDAWQITIVGREKPRNPGRAGGRARNPTFRPLHSRARPH